MLLDIDGLTPKEIYKVMSQTVIPRPVAWIVTEDEGVLNVAPFSYFIPLSSNPPTLLVSIGHKQDGSPKDTLANLRKHRRCTVCIAEAEMMEAVHKTSAPLPHHESEAERFGIATEAFVEGYPPRIKGVPVAYACDYTEEVSLGGTTVPVVLRARQVWLRDDVVTDVERLSIDFDPLVRIGRAYAKLGERLEPPAL